MGDRAYFQATVRRPDLPTFTRVMLGVEKNMLTIQEAAECWEATHEDEEKYITVEDSQMNYGGWDLAMTAAEEGCLFYGFHGAGCEYGEAAFVGAGHQFFGVSQDFYGTIMISVHPETGEPDEHEIANAKDYIKALKVVKTELGRT